MFIRGLHDLCILLIYPLTKLLKELKGHGVSPQNFKYGKGGLTPHSLHLIKGISLRVLPQFLLHQNHHNIHQKNTCIIHF